MNNKVANFIAISLMLIAAGQPFLWFAIYNGLRRWAKDDIENLGLACGMSCFLMVIALALVCAYLIDTKIKKK